jgi:hypothetical protein
VPQRASGLYHEDRYVARDIRCTVILHCKFEALDNQARLLIHLTMNGRFFFLASGGDATRQRIASPIVSMNNQESLVVLDDGDRGSKGSEQWKPLIQPEAALRDDPEQASFQIVRGGRQTESLACAGLTPSNEGENKGARVFRRGLQSFLVC